MMSLFSVSADQSPPSSAPAVTSPASPRILPWIMPVDLKGTGFRAPPSGSVGTESLLCCVVLVVDDAAAVDVVVDSKQIPGAKD